MKGRSGTKPGSILKRQIPIRTFTEWDDARAGFCEVDLVAHDGGNPHGEFCQTLDLTCVATGRTEMRVVKNKAQRWVHEALVDISQALPFELLGIDSDNGSEFINKHLFAWCQEQAITLHPLPPLPQERQLLRRAEELAGRASTGGLRPLRHRSRALVPAGALRPHLRLYVNFFQPQMRLVSKTRRGAKISKTFDRARTPYRRLIESPSVGTQSKQALEQTYLGLNPAELRRQIGRCQDRLLNLAGAKKVSGKEVGPAPEHPWRNDNSWGRSRTFSMRQPMDASRTS